MISHRGSAVVIGTLLWLVARLAWPLGAYEIVAQHSFANPEGVEIVGPFVDADSRPWVLGYHVESAHCLFIGPFDRDDPPGQVFRLPDGEDGPTPTLCIAVEPGPEDGFLVRGYVPADLLSTDPPRGFIASLDSRFATRWLIFDEDQLQSGIYGEPLSPVAWSPDRGRVLTFFLGLLDLGTDLVNQLHGMSIADSTGIVRRTIVDWGDVSDGDLEGLLVMPEAGTFLVIAHSNGTEMLVYDGVERIQAYPGGDVDWSGQRVDHAQFSANGNLYLVHHPRLDTGQVLASLTSLSEDGEIQYYSRSLERTVEVENQQSGQATTLTVNRPVLGFVTDTTVTLLRSTQVEYVLQVVDNFNGRELAMQPLSSIDANVPTHLADARQPDQLVMLTFLAEAMAVTRFVDLIAFNPDAETPGPYPTPEPDGGDFGADTSQSDGSQGDSPGSGDEATDGRDDREDENGCGCQAAHGSLTWILTWLGLAALVFVRMRRHRLLG